jgi:hypothetical protein
MTSNRYHYIPLDKAANEIRLVTIRAAKVADHVYCSLGKYAPSEVPAYEALSYAWGSAADTNSIVLDGFDFQVTTNLHAALRRLRRENQDRLLWIDALCINQKDNLEKNHQVSMMKRIFERAEQVVVWLGNLPGEGNEHIKVVFEKFKFIQTMERNELRSMKVQELEGMFGYQPWKAFRDLFELRWWKRIWTIQEVEVARNILVICGNGHISANRFDAAVNFMRGILLPGYQRAPGRTIVAKSIKSLRVGESRDLLFLARYFCRRESTDQRDKLYALVGIAERMDFEPDYSLSIQETYSTFVTACIKESGTLDVLNFSGLRARIDIPSWTPDWSDLRCTESRTLHQYKTRNQDENVDTSPYFAASGGSRAEFVGTKASTHVGRGMSLDRPCGGLLCTIKGFITDIVLSQSEPARASRQLESPNTPLMRQLISIYQAQSTPSGGAYVTGEDIRNAFWLTLFADTSISDRLDRRTTRASRDSDVKAAGFLLWSGEESGLKPSTKAPDMNAKFYFTLQISLLDRRFAISEKGYFGLVPEETQPGDRICILYGGQTPFILRRVKEVRETLEKGSRDLGGNGAIYQLVGECYIHGIMDGEAYSQFKRGEGGAQEQTFVLM